MRRRGLVAPAMAACLLAGCSDNPRTQIQPIVEAAMVSMTIDAPGRSLCVDRTIALWQPNDEVKRIDTPTPPGFEDLRREGVFRGGGGIKGDMVGPARVGSGAGCFDLRGPLIDGDRAMVEVHLPGIGHNIWLRRTGPDWRAVMSTTSEYPN